MEINIQDLIQKAESGDAEALFNLGYTYYEGNGLKEDKEKAFECFLEAGKLGHVTAQYNTAEIYASKLSLYEAMHWFGKAARSGLKEANIRMNDIRLLIVKECCYTYTENAYMKYNNELELFKQKSIQDIDLFIENCKKKHILRPKHYTWISDDKIINLNFIKPYPTSIKDKGFKEYLLGLLLQMKSDILWENDHKADAHAYLDASWEVVKDFSESWVADSYLAYCDKKGDFFWKEDAWEKAETVFADINIFHYYTNISQYEFFDEVIYAKEDIVSKNLYDAEYNYYNSRLKEIYSQWKQGKNEIVEKNINSLLNIIRLSLEHWNTGVALYWICEDITNEYSQEEQFNLLRLLKVVGLKPLWSFCNILCRMIESYMDERGVAEEYEWPRELYDAVEKMFNTVIPYIEQNLEDNNHKQILAYLNIYKGEYMMQTRRFAVAEKHLQIALSLLKDSLMVERNDCIPGIALTIGLLDDLYSVQNQKAEKFDYLWELMNLFQENEKCEDYYLTLKEKLEQK